MGPVLLETATLVLAAATDRVPREGIQLDRGWSDMAPPWTRHCGFGLFHAQNYGSPGRRPL
ncbi:hypothetical protein GA0115254_104034 [Streptomyces sp. Ncost-T10-10d]|nr:hypothetical protein GA0115254_104034 [Streptomyces sp. Ncost-T10-10d]